MEQDYFKVSGDDGLREVDDVPAEDQIHFFDDGHAVLRAAGFYADPNGRPKLDAADHAVCAHGHPVDSDDGQEVVFQVLANLAGVSCSWGPNCKNRETSDEIEQVEIIPKTSGSNCSFENKQTKLILSSFSTGRLIQKITTLKEKITTYRGHA